MRYALAVALAGLIGCSNSNEPSAGNATPAGTITISLSAIPVAHDRGNDLSGISQNATGDLDAIVGRRYLRVLVARSRTDFENRDGKVRGYAVDAGVALETMLAKRGTLVSVVFIETAEDQLIRDLLAGKGDIAANLLRTFERDEQVAFAAPIRTGIRELVVNGLDETHVVSLEDVGSRSIHVRESSDHHASLVRLNEQLRKIARPQARIVLAPPTQTDVDLLHLVDAGKIPATIAYDYEYEECCATRLPGVKSNRDVAVSQDGEMAWVTRKDAPKLLAVMNEFFSTHMLLRGVH